MTCEEASLANHAANHLLLHTRRLDNLGNRALRMVTHVLDDLLFPLLFLLAAIRADAGVVD